MNLVNFLHRQKSHNLKTFGPFHPSNIEGIVKHIEKELIEVRDNPSDLMEHMDVALLAFKLAMNAGYSPEMIAAGLERKQLIVESRDWPDYRTVPAGEPIEHVRR